MAEALKIAFIQANLVWENPEANLQLFQKEIEDIQEPIDLIVLPEMFSTAFSMNAEKLAEPPQGKSFLWMKNTAITNKCAVTGSLIITDNGHFYNRLYFVFPNGDFTKYDKRHTFTLAKENETYTAGKERLIVNYEGWRICPLVCYDLRFPVWARNTEDYDVLVYVANWPEKRVAAWDALLKARAIENMAYCIGVNRVGKDGNGHPYVGHSAVYNALGTPITPLNREESFTEIVSLHKSSLKESRESLKFLLDRDKFTLE